MTFKKSDATELTKILYVAQKASFQCCTNPGYLKTSQF